MRMISSGWLYLREVFFSLFGILDPSTGLYSRILSFLAVLKIVFNNLIWEWSVLLLIGFAFIIL
jgi:hypothetical protein